MTGDIIDHAHLRAKRAGTSTIPSVTLIPLIDIDALTAAEFLAVKPWAKRAAWFDSIIADSLCRFVDVYLPGNDDQDLFAVCVGGMREKITLVLSHLDRLAPLPPDDEAFRIFRVSDDPKRVAMAAEHWGNDETELCALGAYSGFMVLRNITIAIAAGALRVKGAGLAP